MITISLLLLSVLLLWSGANWLVESAGRIAKRFGISELVIGLTVVAFGTSAPEFAVTVTAAIQHQSDISVGNIAGSNIFNLGFILGGIALLRPVVGSRKLVLRDGLFMLATSLLLLLLFYTHTYTLVRIEGAILFGLLIGYISYLFIHREPVIADEVPHEAARLRDYFIAPLSILMVSYGGHLLVTSASSLAAAAGIPQWFIAITVVAAGTSAPELVTSLAAILKGRYGISAGNLVGSNIFNLLGVLGVASMINPLSIPPHAYQSLILLCVLIVLAVIFLRTGWQISRLEGFILVLTGLCLWAIDFFEIYFIGNSGALFRQIQASLW